MFHRQVDAVCDIQWPQGEGAQALTLAGVVDDLTDMDLTDLLRVSCVLWVAAPEIRQEGYATSNAPCGR